MLSIHGYRWGEPPIISFKDSIMENNTVTGDSVLYIYGYMTETMISQNVFSNPEAVYEVRLSVSPSHVPVNASNNYWGNSIEGPYDRLDIFQNFLN